MIIYPNTLEVMRGTQFIVNTVKYITFPYNFLFYEVTRLTATQYTVTTSQAASAIKSASIAYTTLGIAWARTNSCFPS